MISLDKILFEVISQNCVTIYVFITLLKGIAMATDNVEDDKIATLLSNVFNSVVRRKKATIEVEVEKEEANKTI